MDIYRELMNYPVDIISRSISFILGLGDYEFLNDEVSKDVYEYIDQGVRNTLQ